MQDTMSSGNVLNYTTEQLNRGSVAPFTRDYLGGIQLLEGSGFSSFTESSPMNSVLGRVFTQFVEKTGIGNNAELLRNEYLAANPTTQRAMDLYQSLENTFSARRPSEQAAIVDFLNTQIDEYISSKDSDQDSYLTLQESNLNESLFEEIDNDNDSRVNADEFKSNFYDNFQQLNNVMSYFKRTPGVLMDIYG